MSYLLIVQVLLDEPFEALRPEIEKLLDDKDKNKQRAAAEFIAGVLGGTCLISVHLRSLC